MNTIRDPIHGIIKFSNPIKEIINHPFMQRLRRCSQLSCVDQVFPNAVHNRFAHSLGVMYLARKYMKYLLVGYYTTLTPELEKYITLAEIAGLCHDIGHGPYSHSFDLAVYAKIYDKSENSHWPDGGHDIHRNKIVSDPSFAMLVRAAGITVEDLVKVYNAEPGQGIYSLISVVVGGPLGADRMDFVMRDAYFCGTTHLGTIAHERIISKTILCCEDNQYTLLYKKSCLNDIIHALDGRRYMYNDVYFHDVAISASVLIHKFLGYASDELWLVSDCDDLSQFVHLDEQTLAGRILALSNASPAKKWFLRFRNRQLPTVISSRVEKITQSTPPSGIYEQDGYCTFVSRPFTGIDPGKFNHYGIKFISKSGQIISCADAISEISFTPSPAYKKIVKVRL